MTALEKPRVISKEMSLVPDEFRRQLARLAERLTLAVEREQNRYHLTGPDSLRVCIDLEQLPPRRIASISLPVMQVRIEFLDATSEQFAEFKHCFDLYFRKGGG
ncbi:hypothetical protein [Aestuariirhabdus sp. LZHN29]|uniref:hypothetical protein n=1 Tax=Aestuariirhabdus sp. LZHN29 TaxID=3417462 RepID=UPI003CFB3E3E